MLHLLYAVWFDRFTGLSWDKLNSRWEAYVYVQNPSRLTRPKKLRIGMFAHTDEEKAARLVDEHRIKHVRHHVTVKACSLHAPYDPMSFERLGHINCISVVGQSSIQCCCFELVGCDAIAGPKSSQLPTMTCCSRQGW